MKQCSACKETKELSKFNNKSASHDGKQSICRECNKERSKRYYRENREKHKQVALENKRKYRSENNRRVWEILEASSCVDCGNDNPRVLEFDHIAGNKEGDVGRMLCSNVGWTRIKKEIEKCEIVCANCHRMRTQDSTGNWRTLMGV